MENKPAGIEVLVAPQLDSLWVHRNDQSCNFPVMQVCVVGKGMTGQTTDRRKRKTVEECVVYKNLASGSGRLFCRSVREFLDLYLPYEERKGGVLDKPE